MEILLEQLLTKYEATGRVAYRHPRKHTVSFNGGRQMTEAEAIKHIKEFLATLRPCYCDYIFHAGGC